MSRINHNGYVEVRIPNHHRARGNGYVFEHIVVLESKLGRKLEPNEQCHHIDGNRTNNDPENLVALDIREHASETGRARRAKNMLKCPVCNKEFYRKPFEQRKNKRNFCSRRCLGLWSKENNKGVFSIDK